MLHLRETEQPFSRSQQKWGQLEMSGFLFCGALGPWHICIVSFLAGKNFEQISSLGRKYSPTTYMAFGTTRKCEETYTEPLKERKLAILFYNRVIAHSFLFNWLKIAKLDILDQNYFNQDYVNIYSFYATIKYIYFK